MSISNKVNFREISSELMACAIIYFEDFIAILHKSLAQSGFSSFDAFSIIEITISSLTQRDKLQDIIVSLTQTFDEAERVKLVTRKVSEFHSVIHADDPSESIKAIHYEGKCTEYQAALMIIFLNHLCANFLKLAKKEKSKLKSSDIENVKFTKLLSTIFDKAFEKTLSELKG